MARSSRSRIVFAGCCRTLGVFALVWATLGFDASAQQPRTCRLTFDQCRATCRVKGNDDKKCTNKCSSRDCTLPAQADTQPGAAKAEGKTSLPEQRKTDGQPAASGRASANPRSPAADLTDKARKLVNQGGMLDAIPLLDQAINVDPTYWPALQWRGVARNRLGQAALALPDLENAHSLAPKNIDILVARGATYRSLHDTGKALADFNLAGELAPYAASPFAWRGLVYSDQGEQQLALAEINKAISLDPKNWPSYANLGTVYNRLQQYEKAVDAFGKAFSMAPSVGLITSRGYNYLQLGDREHARADFDTALRLNPNSVSAYIGRGRVSFEETQYDDAIKNFDQALSLQPNNVDAALRRARSFELQRNFAAARSDFQKVLDLSPTNVTAATGRDRIDTKISIASGTGSAASAPVRRVALVIGNSHYKAVDQLANTANDAKLIADTFKTLGFSDVRLLLDGSKEQMSSALQALAHDAVNASWAVVYFAGHGLELDGTNYLVPTDVKYENDSDIPKESVPLDEVLNAVGEAANLRLVILDACRENPLVSNIGSVSGSSSVGKGLARIEPESGTLVAFATKHGDLATDGTSGDSPFALALTNRMKAPGLEINAVFRLVHDDVYAMTNKQQEPFTYGQLPAKAFYFRQ